MIVGQAASPRTTEENAILHKYERAVARNHMMAEEISRLTNELKLFKTRESRSKSVIERLTTERDSLRVQLFKEREIRNQTRMEDSARLSRAIGLSKNTLDEMTDYISRPDTQDSICLAVDFALLGGLKAVSNQHRSIDEIRDLISHQIRIATRESAKRKALSIFRALRDRCELPLSLSHPVVQSSGDDTILPVMSCSDTLEYGEGSDRWFFMGRVLQALRLNARLNRLNRERSQTVSHLTSESTTADDIAALARPTVDSPSSTAHFSHAPSFRAHATFPSTPPAHSLRIRDPDAEAASCANGPTPVSHYQLSPHLSVATPDTSRHRLVDDEILGFAEFERRTNSALMEGVKAVSRRDEVIRPLPAFGSPSRSCSSVSQRVDSSSKTPAAACTNSDWCSAVDGVTPLRSPDVTSDLFHTAIAPRYGDNITGTAQRPERSPAVLVAPVAIDPSMFESTDNVVPATVEMHDHAVSTPRTPEQKQMHGSGRLTTPQQSIDPISTEIRAAPSVMSTPRPLSASAKFAGDIANSPEVNEEPAQPQRRKRLSLAPVEQEDVIRQQEDIIKGYEVQLEKFYELEAGLNDKISQLENEKLNAEIAAEKLQIELDDVLQKEGDNLNEITKLKSQLIEEKARVAKLSKLTRETTNMVETMMRQTRVASLHDIDASQALFPEGDSDDEFVEESPEEMLGALRDSIHKIGSQLVSEHQIANERKKQMLSASEAQSRMTDRSRELEEKLALALKAEVQVTEEYENFRAKAKEDLAAAHAQIDELRHQPSHLNLNSKTAGRRTSVGGTFVSELHDTINSLEGEVASLTATRDNLEEKLRVAESRVEDLLNIQRTMETETRKNQAEMDLILLRVTSAEARVLSEKSKLAAVDAQLQLTEDELTACKAENVKLVQSLHQKESSAVQRLEELAKVGTAKTAALSKIEETAARLREDLEATREELENEKAISKAAVADAAEATAKDAVRANALSKALECLEFAASSLVQQCPRMPHTSNSTASPAVPKPSMLPRVVRGLVSHDDIPVGPGAAAAHASHAAASSTAITRTPTEKLMVPKSAVVPGMSILGAWAAIRSGLGDGINFVFEEYPDIESEEVIIHEAVKTKALPRAIAKTWRRVRTLILWSAMILSVAFANLCLFVALSAASEPPVEPLWMANSVPLSATRANVRKLGVVPAALEAFESISTNLFHTSSPVAQEMWGKLDNLKSELSNSAAHWISAGRGYLQNKLGNDYSSGSENLTPIDLISMQLNEEDMHEKDVSFEGGSHDINQHNDKILTANDQAEEIYQPTDNETVEDQITVTTD